MLGTIFILIVFVAKKSDIIELSFAIVDEYITIGMNIYNSSESSDYWIFFHIINF